MNRPGELQTFSFDSAADLHWKLYWEVARMNAAPQDIIDLKCFAFNAAVTAWQLTDWTFDDMSAKQKKDRGVVALVDFQNLVRSMCRPLHLCARIATASKHRIVRSQHHDPSVTTAVQRTATGWELLIMDGSTTYQASDVFEEARMFWFRYLTELGLIH
jgi:hypothetical protein